MLEEIQNQLTKALKSGDSVRVSTLRFLISNLTNARIAKGDELTDEEILSEIKKDAKKHRESIEAFRSGDREEMAKAEEAQLAILSEFLPPQLPDEEIAKLVDESISETGAATKADFGKVMSSVMTKIAGRADGGKVSQILSTKLN